MNVTANTDEKYGRYIDFDVFEEFHVPAEEQKGIIILFAAYEYASYEGYAVVVLLKDGKLYEVHGSHCSCYGLEGQWDLEETTKEALAMEQPYALDNQQMKAFLKLVTEEL